MSISGELKKVLLAGIGAVAMTAEKSKEMVDAFVAKGEITVEQGRVLNEELKRNVSDTLHRSTETKADILDQVEKMTPEQLEQLKKKLNEMETKQDEQGSEAGE